MKWPILLLLLASASLLNAQVLLVPETYPSIADAITAASHGDTVLVNQGTYYENVSFNGKQIVLTSNYAYTGDFEDIQQTIIHGGTPENGDTASCVMFYSGEDSTAVLTGFTLTGGSGTNWVDPQYPAYTWRSGGGIFIFQSSPTIINNLIIHNNVSDEPNVSGASGGGICTYAANPIICNNIIWKNTATYGAGVVIDYSGCQFVNNIVAWNTGANKYGGGGFWTIGNGDESILIQNNTIVYNEATGSGLGGAMYLWSTVLTACNNIIWGNTQADGGQVFLRDNANALITYSNIEGGFTGEGNIDADPTFEDSLFIVQPISPCIDAGHYDHVYDDPEDPGNPGFAKWPAHGTLRNDMGAYGGPDCMTMATGTVGTVERIPDKDAMLLSAFPNPFNDNVRICYRLKKNRMCC